MQNNNEIIAMSTKVKSYRYLALCGHLGLLLWLIIWYFVLKTPSNYSVTFVMLVYIVPLLLPLLGILKAKPYTHAWSCFVVLWYFMHAITLMYAEPQFILHASLELFLAICMFIGCSMFARLRGQELGTALPKLSKVMEEEKIHFEGSAKND